jgi:NAD(P)-dependent dehydrogenase (short-subunit alcohol dehydrogenase family)
MLEGAFGHNVIRSDEKDCDVTSEFAVAKFIEGLPRLDSVVYSAGINHLFHLGSGGPANYARVVEVNLTGFINVVDALAGRFAAPEHQIRIVAVSSDAATRPMRTSIAYCASKAGLEMAIRCAARELASRGWRINGVAPGMVSGTGMTRYVDATVPTLRGWTREFTEDYERLQEVVPGRIHPEEVAVVISEILGWPDHFNGEIVRINGGR